MRRLTRRIILQPYIYFVLINKRGILHWLFFKDNAHLYTATQCVESTDGCLPQAKKAKPRSTSARSFLTKTNSSLYI
ncbi:hypothetical protein DMI70_17475 [Escherichia coli]|nr:hypothetical protein [Escherichia coli]